MWYRVHPHTTGRHRLRLRTAMAKFDLRDPQLDSAGIGPAPQCACLAFLLDRAGIRPALAVCLAFLLEPTLTAKYAKDSGSGAYILVHDVETTHTWHRASKILRMFNTQCA